MNKEVKAARPRGRRLSETIPALIKKESTVDLNDRLKTLNNLLEEMAAEAFPHVVDDEAENLKTAFLYGMQTGIQMMVDETRKPPEAATQGIDDLHSALGILIDKRHRDESGAPLQS